MENSGLSLLIGGVIVILFLVMGGAVNLRRIDTKAMKAEDQMAATGSRVWSYLTPSQQEELKGLDSLLVQEEWIEYNVEPSVLNGVSAERVLIELANRGFISLGRGVFRRHATALDYIKPEAQIIEDTESDSSETVDSSDSKIDNDEHVESIEQETSESKKVTSIVLVTECQKCQELLGELHRTHEISKEK